MSYADLGLDALTSPSRDDATGSSLLGLSFSGGPVAGFVAYGSVLAWLAAFLAVPIGGIMWAANLPVGKTTLVAGAVGVVAIPPVALLAINALNASGAGKPAPVYAKVQK
jgi:hypothetical protein